MQSYICRSFHHNAPSFIHNRTLRIVAIFCKGTGDVLTDMTNQVKANEIRIDLLGKQNSTMKKTLDKLQQRRKTERNFQNTVTDVKPDPPAYSSVSTK